jgi:hypothetical protein
MSSKRVAQSHYGCKHAQEVNPSRAHTKQLGLGKLEAGTFKCQSKREARHYWCARQTAGGETSQEPTTSN